LRKKSWLLILSTVLVFAVIVSGCGGPKKSESSSSPSASESESSNSPSTSESSSPESSAPPEKITFKNGMWAAPTDEQLPQLQGYEKKFKELYPNVDIQSEFYEYDTNNFLPRAVSGQLPNLYSTWFTETQKIIKAGYARDITNVLQEVGYDQALNPQMMGIFKDDNKIYGLPLGGYYVGLWYNVNLFKKAGLVDANGVPKYPQTYDELLQTAKTIKDKTGKAGFFYPTKNNQGGWMFMNIAWAYGAEFEQQQADGKWKAIFNSPEAVQALQVIHDMKWKYDVLPANNLVDISDGFRMLGTDQVGMEFGSFDWVQNPINDYKMSKDNEALSRMPAGPKGRIALTGGSALMFSK
jgi:multiple sugar transport system substrate-binding protein